MTSAALQRQANEAPVVAITRAALYLRVSTGRQAESDLSIPDQRRQVEGYCLSRGWEVAAEFVEPGNTATDDRRPAFQAMIDAATEKPPTLTVIVVHSFSRFFHVQFQFDFYARKLAKNGVRLVSITQALGDDPISVMMRHTWLNENNIRTRDGGRWGIAGVHQVLTRTTYIGRHKFNYRDYRTKAAKPQSEHAVMGSAGDRLGRRVRSRAALTKGAQ